MAAVRFSDLKSAKRAPNPRPMASTVQVIVSAAKREIQRMGPAICNSEFEATIRITVSRVNGPK